MKLFKKFSIRIILVVTLVFFLVGCDQAKKQAAYQLKDNPKTDTAGIVHLQYIENDGGMLSLASNLPQELKFVVFIVVVSVFLVLLFLYIIKNKQDSLLKHLGLIFIFSGGLGNLIDRVFNNGNVIDFIRISLPLIEVGIFNIADFYITMGFAIIFLGMILKPKVLTPEITNSI